MINLTKEQLIKRIELFDDSKVICEQLGVLCEDEDYADGNLYWLREAQENLTGMFKLLMDLKKQHLLDSDSADIIKTEANEATELTMVDIGLDAAIIFTLCNININTIGELITANEVHMLKAFKRIGIKDGNGLLTEIKNALEVEGLSLGMVFD
jgi:DNA-directed RNA polymerase alpha subunit